MQAGHPFNETLNLVAEDMEEPVSREFAKPGPQPIRSFFDPKVLPAESAGSLGWLRKSLQTAQVALAPESRLMPDVRRAMLGLLQRVPTVTVMALVTAILLQKQLLIELRQLFGAIAKNLEKGQVSRDDGHDRSH